MEMPLQLPCPVCVDDGRFTQSFNWKHSPTSCNGGGGGLMLDDDATIRCTASNCQTTWNLIDSLWGCPHHSNPDSSSAHSYEYRKASYVATVEALRFACSKYKNTPGQAWFDRLMRNLDN